MKPNNYKIHHAASVNEAIDNIQDFFEEDMWYDNNEEWETEKDMKTYLRTHFKLLKKEIRRLIRL